ncbi:ferredoxin-type protein NapG [Halarcobacter bivalviorum]|uniref:Ferredoxin-type protein NapG n=1 Tax=Halarcobacter bivalviorum TaxID=663364 RepID=A0AAX2A6D2_9BACT|nr:ferredoxin-type protein NapG [Halarcobacter bivalviorum]AXH13588.1 menaquinol dehydrogenase NapGH, periplasmic component NapG [Halarcobacter bivalviorum]RXK06640.1 ferredoxin-type protein NapG [Halarcobacter bivalviorum]RXK09807.1 ferredoxin-type protein NapG [Halarcobacter bivalviorum]
MKKEVVSDRRRFFLNMARAFGLATLGALTWSAYVDEVTASELTLRPPAALDEEDFLKTCIKCGMCVEACPFDTLSLAKPGDNKPLGTPYFTPRDIPCYMCPDIPCVPVCPTNALDITKVTKNNKLDINMAQMGVAVVDSKNCIAFWGIQCDACYRACPILGDAITIEYSKNERTGKHAFMKPVVNSDSCTGCGLCEKACVTDKAAIFVLPREVALGKVGDYYIKGWDKADEKRLEKVTSETTKTEISNRKAVDSLNDMEGLLND